MSRKISPRAAAAIASVFSGLLLAPTGLLVHLAGHGHGNHPHWSAFHFAVGLLFTASVILHLVLNRRALWCHLQTVIGR